MADISKDKLQKLQSLLKIANDGLTRDEFVKAFEAVIKLIADLEAKLIEKADKKTENTLTELDNLKKSFIEFIEQAKKEGETTIGAIRRSAADRVDNAFVKNEANKRLNTALGAVNERLKDLDRRIAEIKDGVNGKDGKDADEQAIFALLLEKLPDFTKFLQTPEQIRDYLELLQGDERLKIEAIDNLREELDELKKRPTGGVQGGIIGRNLIKNIDISSQLDGSTKTFNIHSIWSIISVHASSSPWALRPTIDYTHTTNSITFTDQIDAPTTLAAGQTIILTVVSG